MGSMMPVNVYGLRVPAGGFPVPGANKFPATFRITMAAIDPSAEPQIDEENKLPRATLKLIRIPTDDDEDSEDEDEDDEDYSDVDIETIKERLKGIISDEDEDMSDDSEVETNGGPSDPVKSKKAKAAALSKKLQEELAAEEMDISMTNGVNGKGKGKAHDHGSDEECDSDDSDMDEDDEPEEFVLCTLDPEKNYQQTLDITIGEHEQVYFAANGTYDVYITGNYVFPADMDEDDEDDYDSEEDYDLPPSDDELDGVSESEDDHLDTLEDPRITEVDSESEAPKLVEPKGKKGKKRAAEDTEEESSTLDAMISKNKDGEQKLSKKEAKKLKKNDGQAAAATQDKKEAPGSDKKKVQFSKNLEMGPTGSPKVEDAKKPEAKKEAAKTGPRNVGGVLVEDKKVGKGKAATKGSRVEMRYIGKLKNGKQFDANKKGKPFSFKLGVGEVIRGWDVGIQGITAGGERRLTIPANLAYGSKALPDIPANSDLIFDVKCISVS